MKLANYETQSGSISGLEEENCSLGMKFFTPQLSELVTEQPKNNDAERIQPIGSICC
jgi:hypothetical protein